MERRDFISLLGGTAIAWPLKAYAQQAVVPVVGFLYAGSLNAYSNSLAAFRRGLREAGFIEGQNVLIEYRSAENRPDLLPELATDLVRRGVAVIAAPGSREAVLAAMAATTTIPIVFSNAGDPVQSGLVSSFNRPGANVTGITDMGVEVSAKRVGLLHELLPKAAHLAALVTPGISTKVIAEVQAAASTIGLEFEVLTASNSREIDEAFATFLQKRADALWVSPGALFLNRRVQIVILAARYAVPAIYPLRNYVEAGGLMSYGSSLADRSRQAGVYTGRILKGEKPADLPILRATKFEFVINIQTARTLGITVPATLLSQADEVIE